MKGKTSTGVLALVALLAAAGGAWLGNVLFAPDAEQPAGRQVLELEAATVLPESKGLKAFELIDYEGKAFTRAQLEDRWTFVMIGYTYRPDICPFTMAHLENVNKLIQGSVLADDTNFLFVSVDPRRDNPKRIEEYVKFFNPRFLGVTGDPQALDKWSRDLGLVFEVPEAPENEDYLVAHSSYVALIGPDADLQAYFRPPFDPAKMADAYRAIREFRKAS